MQHLTQMRTRFELDKIVIWKGEYGIYKGRVVGLHDDFVFIREIIILPSGMKMPGTTYRVQFEDVIGEV